MGRSLRRAKRFRPKLTAHKKRQKQCKADIPVVLKTNEIVIEDKLPAEAGQWDTTKTYVSNYKSAGVIRDPNAAVGVKFAENIEPVIRPEDATDEEPQDDDLRALLSLERLHGKALPAKLSTHQQQVMQRLIAAHGHDLEAMAKDRKLNQMLLPVSKLRKQLLSYYHGKVHRFQAPHKHNH